MVPQQWSDLCMERFGHSSKIVNRKALVAKFPEVEMYLWRRNTGTGAPTGRDG
jgi:hypothetical protein